MPLIPAFQLNLGNSVMPRLATVGRYDGKHPSLTCATSAGKVFVHSPHLHGEGDGEVRFLSINQRITALAAGSIKPGTSPGQARDCLFVGTPTNLLLYDVQENCDVFYKEVEDGVNAIALGRLQANADSPMLAIVGGSCNLQGFDHEGAEAYWSVTGDNVSAIAIWDVDGDGRPEILVGSEDCAIRVFRGDEVVAELPESDVVCGLCPMRGSSFGYTLANGSAGMYDGMRRAWRVKSKNTPVCLSSFDLDDDGVPELVIGWSNGRLEVRSDKGELVYRDQFASSVAAITAADYRMDGKQELIVCSSEGEVRGYLPTKPGAQGTLLEKSVVEETLIALSQRKQQLQFELRHYEDIAKASAEPSTPESPSSSKEAAAAASPIPAPSEFTYKLVMSPDIPEIRLVLTAPAGLNLRAAAVFAEQSFPQGAHFVHPKEATGELVVGIAPQKNLPDDLSVRGFIGTHGGAQFLSMELGVKLPKFAMFVQVPTAGFADPASRVSFQIPERVARASMWLKQSFIVTIPAGSDTFVDAAFVSLRDKRPLHLTVSADSTVAIRTDDMELAGEIVQDLCEVLKITELDSTAAFPIEMEQFRHTVASVGEYNQARVKLTTEMADSSNLIKTLLVKAEDCRLLGDMRTMKQVYATLYEINRELIGEYKKRENNQAALMRSLKDMNQTIQRAARLRVGSPKSKIIAASREAVVSNNIEALFKILKVG